MPIESRLLASPTDPALDADWVAAGPFADTMATGAPLPPEARRIVVYRKGRPVARAGFGARTGFNGAPGVTGYVGWYWARDMAGGVRAITEAAALLDAEGAERVVGPLDGSTWYRYRVALPRDMEIEGGESFLSEPGNPADWAAHFQAARFRPELEYETRLVRRPLPDPAAEGRRAELAAVGVTIRPIDLGSYEREIRALYELSVAAFAENPFYTPISFPRFQSLYAGLRPLLDPRLVRLAMDDGGRLLAYVFAFPDALADPGNPRIVLKTLAAHRDARGMGLGGMLVSDIHAIAAERGAGVLHALMQTSNFSKNISRRSGSELFRRYTLYQRRRP